MLWDLCNSDFMVIWTYQIDCDGFSNASWLCSVSPAFLKQDPRVAQLALANFHQKNILTKDRTKKTSWKKNSQMPATNTSTWWKATTSAESFFGRADLSRKLLFGSSNHQNCRVPPWEPRPNGDKLREKSSEAWFNGDMSHLPGPNFHPNLPTTSPLPDSRNQIRGTMKNSASAVQSYSLVLTSLKWFHLQGNLRDLFKCTPHQRVPFISHHHKRLFETKKT